MQENMEKQRAGDFIKRLLANPALEGLNSLQKEEQILQFLKINSQTLFPTLSSGEFFPGRNWNQIMSLIEEYLAEIINKTLFEEMAKSVASISFNFTAFLREQGTGIENLNQSIIDFEKKILLKTDARRQFAGPLTAVLGKLTDKYIDEAFYRREYIYFELVKVQKLKMSKEDIKNMLKATLILKNSINLLTVSHDRKGMASGVVQNSFTEKALEILHNRLMIVPIPLMQSALKSNISFLENSSMPTTSRLAAVFSYRYMNYKSQQNVDRGADTPDKSWFGVARRNYKYYGFDIKMLDELYKMAGENGW